MTRYEGLIVGLGNPSKRYYNTRHNIGFLVLDEFIKECDRRKETCLPIEASKGKYHAWQWEDNDHSWILAKPLTYMNRSGTAVSKIRNNYKFENEQIIVIHDELDLPFGKLRLKFDGGLAGHNGLKSIASELDSKEFYRLRVGIGRPRKEDKDNDIVKYVLSEFYDWQKERLQEILRASSLSLRILCKEGHQKAMNILHSEDIINQDAEKKENYL